MIRKLQKLILALVLTFGSSISAIKAEDEPPLEKSIESFLENVYKSWNKHDAAKLFSNYSSSFESGDGLNKDELKELTETLWENYPDSQVESQTRTVRVQDQYASVTVIDFFHGKSAEEHEELGEKGSLSAISQGELFLKKFGDSWKIVSDKTNFELITVHFGTVKDYLDSNQIYFAVPEQVKSGEQYTGTLYFILPENVQATATINQEPITDDPGDINESFQAISAHKLERLFSANETNHNELVSATVILTKGILEPQLEGLLFIAKRVNILPNRKKIVKQEKATVAFAKSKEKKPKEEKKDSTKASDKKTVN